MEQVHRHPRPGRLPCRPLAQVQPVTWTWPSPGRVVLAAANAGLGRLCPLGQGPGPQRPSGCLPPHTQQAGGPSPQSPPPGDRNGAQRQQELVGALSWEKPTRTNREKQPLPEQKDPEAGDRLCPRRDGDPGGAASALALEGAGAPETDPRGGQQPCRWPAGTTGKDRPAGDGTRDPGAPCSSPPHRVPRAAGAQRGDSQALPMSSRLPLPQCAARGHGVPGRAAGGTGLRRGAPASGDLGQRHGAPRFAVNEAPERGRGAQSPAASPGPSARLVPKRWPHRLQRPLPWPRTGGRADGQQRHRAPRALGSRGLFEGLLSFLLGTGPGCVLCLHHHREKLKLHDAGEGVGKRWGLGARGHGGQTDPETAAAGPRPGRSRGAATRGPVAPEAA